MIPEWLATIPASTFFILGISALTAFISSVINRFSMSEEERKRLKALRTEMGKLRKEWGENRKTAKETDSKKLDKKVQKQEKRLLQLQTQMAKLSFRRMRVYPITFVIFILIWALFTGRILFWPVFETPFSTGQTIAYLPGNFLWFGERIELNFFWWYLLCSFLCGTLFSRAFGLTPGGGGE
ncbi:DUF106 domain-containing protein [Candidatus Bathyarchaeota archaeon]|nr:DUF106 domain-containing protein [Candidatus Bathyarchaeota archaeon]NIU81620.1 DUF106 domain-containing protein [Candidatus Bathyarchaeota archaeon]NIV68265.1 DUF106 domain-containing protein [Candidatus Bathyarchaeota archaeon]NIW16606.1 DUF106 domain-containing protein [Candidatus Bathyarchaeota archaeon]NIW34806.1 DUF106 domain-containing protein [Candidatus Bathyarchaeota archaeon]